MYLLSHNCLQHQQRVVNNKHLATRFTIVRAPASRGTWGKQGLVPSEW